MAKGIANIVAKAVQFVPLSPVARTVTTIGTAIANNKTVRNYVQTTARQVVNNVVDSAMKVKVDKHNEVLSRWLGKRVKESGYDTYECVAWVKQYVQEAIGSRPGTFGGKAKNGWTASTFKNWKKEAVNSSGPIPPVGALVFWGASANNPNGHVAIADAGSTGVMMNIIEQNGETGKGTGLGGDAIRRTTIEFDGRGPLLGWIMMPGWENVTGQYSNIPVNTNADGSTIASGTGLLGLVYKDDPQLQKLIDLFESILGIGGKKETVEYSGGIVPQTEFEEFIFRTKNTTTAESLDENTSENIKENLNGIMIATMLEILKRMIGLSTGQGTLNGANTGTTSIDSQNTTPQKTTDDGIKTEVAKIPATYAGTYGESLNKLKGDLRSKASTSGNEFSFKGNNPAGMKFGGNNSQTYKALNFAGVQIDATSAKVPSGETLSYYVFKTIEDGIKAQRSYWALYILWDKNDAWTEGNPNGSVKHALQHWGTGSLVQDLSFPLETRIKDLTEEQISELMVKQLQKESPKLYAYMMSL